MRCPLCSFENPGNARFCNQCGSELRPEGPRADERSFYERVSGLDPFAPYEDPYVAPIDPTLPFGARAGNVDTVPFGSAPSFVEPAGNAPAPADGNPTVPFASATAARDSYAAHYPDGTPYTGPDEDPKAFRGELSRDEQRRIKREQRALDKEARRQQREARKEQRRIEKEEMKLLSASEKAQGGSTAPAATSAPPAAAEKGGGRMPSMPSSSARKRKRLVAAAIMLACILLAAGAAVTYSMQLWGGRVVPDVTGLTSEGAAKVLNEAGFSVSTDDVRSDEAPGTVLACEPAAGYRVEPGSNVMLQVAVARTVPDIVGRTQAEAEQMIAEEGLANVSFEYQRSDEAADMVLSVAPPVGSDILSSTAVTVTVAQPYTVPDVVGKGQEEAQAAVEQAGFVVAVARTNDEEAEEGSVLSIDPPAGEKRASGSTVTLSIAHHRSAEAIELTRRFLTESKEMTIKGQACVVDEVKSITYSGDNTCEFSIVMRPYETHTWMFGWGTETRYGNPETVTGRIVWDDNDAIVSVDPSMKQGA